MSTSALDRKVALVTGGASGIGRATAQLFAREGASVVITDLNEQAGNATVEEISRQSGRAIFQPADVTNSNDCQRVVDRTLREFGRIDVLFNNAGIIRRTSILDLTEDDWDRVMDVNVRGMFLMAKYVAPTMIAQRSGKIINIGSGTAFRGVANLLHYATSKGAVVAFTRALSRELGDYGICVNTLAPGFTLSDSVLANNPGHVSSAREPAIQRRAIKRDERPEDLLGALIFLASSESDFITGQTIAVDGGAVNT